MRKIIVLIYITGLLLHSGCSENKAENAIELPGVIGDKNAEPEENKKLEKVSVQDYATWIEDINNGLKVEKTIEDFTYSLQYKPTEYVALLELKKDSVHLSELNKKISEYDGLQYFSFRISTESRTELLKKNLAGANEYYGRIQYFSFDMQKDLKLIEGKDTLDCVLFHFERVFGLAPYATFVLGFPIVNGEHDKTLYYNEKVFGAGKIYLTVKSKNIKKLPSVITY